MGVELTRCPSCQMNLEKIQSVVAEEELTFCPRCQFPLLLIAGKYRLQRILKRGGCGIVYLARHIHLDQDAERVIKVIRPEIFNIQGMEKRFRREVQITSALSQRNEHIVRIYDDFGELPELGHFYVMEYLQGEPLTQLLKREKRPSLPLTLHLFLQLCETMLFAHETGVVHRDLKPDNLMLVPRKNDPYFLKILDFGIAKPTTNDEFEVTQVTQGSLGTPMYMSPEQCINQPTDARTDIYSMGILLYEMLAGHPPFMPPQGAVSEHTMFVSVLESQITKPPPSLTERFPERVHPRLEQIVFKALQKKPAARYQSVEELKEDIEEFISFLSPQDRELIINLASAKDSSFSRRLLKRERGKNNYFSNPIDDIEATVPNLEEEEDSQQTLALGQFSNIKIFDGLQEEIEEDPDVTIKDMPAISDEFAEALDIPDTVVLSNFEPEEKSLDLIPEDALTTATKTLVLQNKPATVAMFPSAASSKVPATEESEDPFLIELKAAFEPKAKTQVDTPAPTLEEPVILLKEKILPLKPEQRIDQKKKNSQKRKKETKKSIKVALGKEEREAHEGQKDRQKNVGTVVSDNPLQIERPNKSKKLLNIIDRVQKTRKGIVNLFIVQKKDWESDPLLAKKLKRDILKITGSAYSSALDKLYQGYRRQLILECSSLPPAGLVKFLEEMDVELRLLPAPSAPPKKKKTRTPISQKTSSSTKRKSPAPPPSTSRSPRPSSASNRPSASSNPTHQRPQTSFPSPPPPSQWNELEEVAPNTLMATSSTMLNIAYFILSLAVLAFVFGWIDMTKVIPPSTPRFIVPSAVSAKSFPKSSYVTVTLRPDRRTFVLIPVRSIHTGMTENFVLFAAKENRRLVVFSPERESQILQDIEQVPYPDNPSLRHPVPIWAKDVRTLESKPQKRTYTGVLERLQRRKGGPLELVLPDENRNINRIPGLVHSNVQFPMDSMVLLVGQVPKPPPKKYPIIFSISFILGLVGFILLLLARQRMQRSF